MIGRLRGILQEKAPPHLLLDVNGISYEIEAPMFTFYRLPEIGETVHLYTHLVVREDAHLLYGFSQERERALFRSLIKVSAIGPKSALGILSGIEPNDFVHCVLQNDTASLVRIPGIGKKTAERLVIEMRDRFNDWKTEDMPELEGRAAAPDLENKMLQEATSALIALGYKPAEARQAVTQVIDDHTSSEEVIRHALRSMMKGGSRDRS